MPWPQKTVAPKAPAPIPDDPRRHLQTSASQFKTWSRCHRLWWLDKVAKVRPKQKHYLALGKALHSVAERYQLKQPLWVPGWQVGLTQQETDWIARCADLAISKGLWQADPMVEIEAPVCALVREDLVDDRGMPLLCRADIVIKKDGERAIAAPTHFHPEFAGLMNGLPLASSVPDNDFTTSPYIVGFMDVLLRHRSPPETHDHKTAKHRGYAKGKDSLLVDEQMNIYACIILAMCPEAESVWVQHNVFLKEYKKDEEFVYPVRAQITLAQARAFWEKYVTEVAEQQRIRATVKAGVGPCRADAFAQVPGLVTVLESRFAEPPPEEKKRAEAKDGCGAYGGCAFRDACWGRRSIAAVVGDVDRELAKGAALSGNVAGQRATTDYKLKPRGTYMGATSTRLYYPK